MSEFIENREIDGPKFLKNRNRIITKVLIHLGLLEVFPTHIRHAEVFCVECNQVVSQSIKSIHVKQDVSNPTGYRAFFICRDKDYPESNFMHHAPQTAESANKLLGWGAQMVTLTSKEQDALDTNAASIIKQYESEVRSTPQLDESNPLKERILRWEIAQGYRAE